MISQCKLKNKFSTLIGGLSAEVVYLALTSAFENKPSHSLFMFFLKIEPQNFAALNILVALDAQIFDAPWSEPLWRAEVENNANCVYIISGDEELLFPAGFITYGISGDTIELKKIAVLSQYRKSKFASAALTRMMEDALSQGINNIIAEVAITNIAAIRLYEHFGFYKIHIRKKYYHNLIDAIIMQKEI